MTETVIPKFPDDLLQPICDALAHPTAGLTGSEIGTYLLRLDAPDLGAMQPKRARLYEGLRARQERDHDGTVVAAFIQVAMDPARYSGLHHVFEARRGELNDVIARSGLEVREDGRLHSRATPRTLDEAEGRAARFREELEHRDAHPAVAAACRADLLVQGNWQVAQAAARGVSDRLRALSGLTSDGGELAEKAFGTYAGRAPLVAVSGLRTDAERSEHYGLASMVKGLLAAFRGVAWSMTDADLLDLLTTASFLHRRLDGAPRVRSVADVARGADGPDAHAPH